MPSGPFRATFHVAIHESVTFLMSPLRNSVLCDDEEKGPSKLGTDLPATKVRLNVKPELVFYQRKHNAGIG